MGRPPGFGGRTERKKGAGKKRGRPAAPARGGDKCGGGKAPPHQAQKGKDAGKMPALQKREADPSPPFPRQPLRPLAAGERRDWVRDDSWREGAGKGGGKASATHRGELFALDRGDA